MQTHDRHKLKVDTYPLSTHWLNYFINALYLGNTETAHRKTHTISHPLHDTESFTAAPADSGASDNDMSPQHTSTRELSRGGESLLEGLTTQNDAGGATIVIGMRYSQRAEPRNQVDRAG